MFIEEGVSTAERLTGVNTGFSLGKTTLTHDPILKCSSTGYYTNRSFPTVAWQEHCVLGTFPVFFAWARDDTVQRKRK